MMTAERIARLFAKSRLRLAVAWRMLREFEDTLPRSRCKLSFSQSGEDLIAWFLLQHFGIHRPTYVDVGAHHPEHLSNTALFYLLGGHGVNIEPDPQLFPAFPRHRPRDVNLNVGIARSPGRMTYYRMSDPALGTFCEEEALRLSSEEGIAIEDRLEVPVDTIQNVLASCRCRPDFLTIDAEGKDLEILEAYDFAAHRPAVVCVETISFSLHGDGRKNEAVARCMVDRGYRTYADTYVNTIFVDDARFRSLPSAASNGAAS